MGLLAFGGLLLPARALRQDGEGGSWAPRARWLRGEPVPWALQPLWLPSWISSLARLRTGWASRAGDAGRAGTAPCCSQAQGAAELGGPDRGHHGESVSPETLYPETLSPEATGVSRGPVPEEWAEDQELPSAAR